MRWQLAQVMKFAPLFFATSCPPLPHRFLFGKPFQKWPTGPSQDLFLLSIGWINRECSVNSIIQIYDKEEPNGLIYETDKAGIEAENCYQGVIAIRSQKGNPQKSGHDLAR